MTYQTGDKVVFRADMLGLVTDESHPFFADEVVNDGDTGEVIGPHPTIDGWLLVRPDQYPDAYAPVVDDMIEAAK